MARNKESKNQKQHQKTVTRLGKRSDDIFKKPIEEKKELVFLAPEQKEKIEENTDKSKQVRGRPQEHKENWSKVTVVFLDKQIYWLDQLASNIRLNTKSAPSRAEILRATISAIEESGLDLSLLRNEEEIKTFLLEKLRK